MTRDLHPDAKTDLHPDAAQFLRERQDRPGLHEVGAKAARRQHRQSAAATDDPEPVGSVEDVVVRSDGHGVGVRLYVPEGPGPFPTLVWAHGGGFVLGDIETEDPVGRALTNATDCLVASVDYRLAPEHKFPAALRDVYAVTEWASEEAGAYGGDPDRIAVGGASAGGSLAAATSLLARDRDGPAIDYQVLGYPAVSYDEEFPSNREYDGMFLEAEEREWVTDQYLPDPIHGYNPYAYPLKASDLGDLPPATVLTAGFDPLQDACKAYADRLADAGVDVTHRHFDDMIHSFLGRVGDPDWERAREAHAAIGDDLDERFRG
mgnify:CR=1 FL=1